LGIIGPPAFQAFNSWCDSGNNFLRNLVLQLEDIIQHAVELLREQRCVVDGIDQLHRDPYAIAGLPQRTLDYVADAQIL
jgi:hypothetical protein